MIYLSKVIKATGIDRFKYKVKWCSLTKEMAFAYCTDLLLNNINVFHLKYLASTHFQKEKKVMR
jgi:hypothetical protein